MRVIPEKQAVLVAPKNPRRLLKVIPTAKCVRWKGRKLVAVPHRLDETRVLNNLGLRVPSPISEYYDWPRSYKIAEPFKAQTETAAFLTLNPRAFVLNGLGTGKSLASLWAYDYLRSKGQANKLLVVCPLSTMERTWGDEIFFNFKHLTFEIVHGSAKKRREILERPADVYIVNHHGAAIIQDDLKTRKDIDMVIVDEIAQAARNKRTDMWSALNFIVNGPVKRGCWGLTGTPIPNEPTDAWAQIKLLCPNRVPKYFNRFRDQVMRQVSQFRWIPRPDAIDIVYEAMQPSIRYSREQCVDLPPTIHMTREVPLTKEQKKAYDQMQKTLAAELEAGEILAVNEAVKVSKLVQIACGVVYDTDGEEVTIPSQPRLDEVVDIITQSEGKTIVFVPFRSSLEMVVSHIKDKTGKQVGVIHGGVPKPERDTIFQYFQMDKHPEVIVAQPAAMSHGLTLTAASTIVWYAPVTSADIYEQANGRITRPGQKLTTCVINIEGTAMERRIYARLKDKMGMQGILLEKNLRDLN